jgi:hypothetical protein
MDVKLKAAFGGVSWLPWWMGFSRSNLAPLLDLGDDRVAIRVIKRSERFYEEIARVDFHRSIGTRNIRLLFKDSIGTFTGNVVSDEEAKAALARLRDKGCALSDRARAYLES